MTDQKRIEAIAEFIKEHKLAVLSTVTHDFLPQSAVVGFAMAEEFNIIFGTFDNSRKYQNLSTNPRVSLVIGWEKGKTVQYEGEAEEIKDAFEIENCKRVFLAQVPTATKYVDDYREKFFRIRPRWVRFTEVSVDPWDTFEIKF